MKYNNPIYVTRPFLPPLDEFNEYLKTIWESGVLTNNGNFHKQLEDELAKFIGVPYVSLFANGTLALLTALQALKITGEVITTPFSFVATTHALWWNNIKPVFIDIEPNRFTLDPDRIEAAISPKTTAILPVHVYGYPCFVEQIQEIAIRRGLKVIYDAAHTMGAKYKDKSIAFYGDVSVLSFHATKVFNTFEGGAIISHSLEMKHHIDNLKNFGFRGETTVEEPGINAKMNEVQAAMGLLQLKYLENNIEKRQKIANLYRENLRGIKGISFMEDLPEVKHNYAYFPIFIDEAEYGISRDALYQKLKDNNIFARRYFYPLISRFPVYSGLDSATPANLPVAEKVAQQVICLPIYPELDNDYVFKICQILFNKISKSNE
ncbi:MAG: DegT/DnrJ/EryC1/StrS family aminotransferase [Bacteroidales bacterium]|nr:DegT/DnrJ/EryC1/StrS family aminotransferase [Bacteroidales bacterium]HOL99059.1 DegT/DnrJ/EryC1/StrS family aminotransferase [Bacteroidales bacterium]